MQSCACLDFCPLLLMMMLTITYRPHSHTVPLAINRFRQEYRLERKLLNELSIDPASFPIDNAEELSALVATTSGGQAGRHRISRVVVLHNDKLETFFNPDETPVVIKKKLRSSNDFFDNDSFWSGSITWY